MNKKLILATKLLSFAVIFSLSIIPLQDPDIWFHLKSGEVILQKGLIHYDVFSYSASGREWFPYEWLFQVTTFIFHKWFGFEALKYLMAVVITFMMFMIYRILRKILDLQWALALAVAFYFFVSVFEFLTARPHIFAYTFLIVNLYLILLYFVKGVNKLKWSVPITLLWSNLHGSVFLSVFLFSAYATISFLYFKLSKEKEYYHKFKTLLLFSVVTAIATILPPLGILQYRLLVRFFLAQDLITKFIDEWTPLSANPFVFVILTVTIIIVLGLLALLVIKKRNFNYAIWLIPLAPFIVMAYSASRNLFLAYITVSLIAGFILSQINSKRLVFLITAVVIAGQVFILAEKRNLPRWNYPKQAAEFIKSQKIAGNMFNDYGYGGYLLYQLYPEQKVFYDGRTDVYLCCEIKDTFDLSLKKNLADNEYKKVVEELFGKYKVSYFILRTQKHSVLRKIARIYSDDPNWSLVFWDDAAQIFVKHNGENDSLIEKLGVKYATPYNQDPFRRGKEVEALDEYLKMIEIADSARSRNAVGFIYLGQKRFDEAQVQFKMAIKLDPTFESPYMNLAEMAVANGDYLNGILFYQKAQKLSPDRGLIYIRMGQLYIEGYNDRINAKKVWQEGVKNTVDDAAKDKLKKLLENV